MLHDNIMQPSPADSTRRFSDRVGNYVRYRPAYPKELLQILKTETGLNAGSIIADIGSGTGISSELFLRNGNTVFGVEPNPEMRKAAEMNLQQFSYFHSIQGTAEDTTLPSASVDYVMAAQAFHWFQVQKAKIEFARILRSAGWVVLCWNSRKVDATPFLCAYEELLRRFGTDYHAVRHRSFDSSLLQKSFFGGDVRFHTRPNEQQLGYPALKGRLLSSSYVPNESHPDYNAMIDELHRIFKKHNENGIVRFLYDTEIYFGHIEV